MHKEGRKTEIIRGEGQKPVKSFVGDPKLITWNLMAWIICMIKTANLLGRAWV